MYALSVGMAAHSLLSVAEKMCLIYNACLILTLRMIMAMSVHDAAGWQAA